MSHIDDEAEAVLMEIDSSRSGHDLAEPFRRKDSPLLYFFSQQTNSRWKFSSAGNMLISMLSIDDYSTAKEMAEQWGITTRMVINYCDRNLIQGAVKKGTLWLIPTMAEKPEDRRLKSYRDRQRVEG